MSEKRVCTTPVAVESLPPFYSVLVDLITGLPPSDGFDSVLVMANHGLTKGVNFLPCHKTINTAGVALLFFKYVFSLFQVTLQVYTVSDQGPQFTSVFAQELSRLLQYDLTLSLAYYPQTDSEAE